MVELYSVRDKYNMKYDTVLLESDLSYISTFPYDGCEVLGLSDSGTYCVIHLSTTSVSELISSE